MNFSDLGLSEDVLRAVADAGYTTPTPIQEQAIPQVLMGRDILGCAQTGTGKTAGFTLPMIDVLASGRGRARMPRSLILEPTRELAAQVAQNFEVYGKYHKLNMALIIGGESMADQSKLLGKGVDVLIATPGRLIDIFERGGLLLTDVKILVIDEADRMLDMGFIPDVEKIVGLLPRIRQTLFFSATMPPAIRKLADAFLINPKTITVAPPSTPAASVEQGLLEVPVGGAKHHDWPRIKRDALRRLIAQEDVKSALIFCNRKREVSVLHRSLARHGFNVGQLHGDMVQSARTETLDAFKRGEIAILVCSDVAARGIDISDLSHVFNFDVPSHAEDYVHRIGRTGRAGKSGRAFTFAVPEDGKHLSAIERLIGKPIPRITVEGVGEGEGEPRREGRGERREGRGERRPRRERPRREDKHEEPREEPREESAVMAAEVEGVLRPEQDPPRREPRPPRLPRQELRRERERDEERDRDRGPGPRVKGLGDHVPAFLMRPVTLTTSTPADDDE